MSDMATMPVEELVAEIRIRTHDMDILQAMVFNVLCNRLEQQADLLGTAEARVAAALRKEQEAVNKLNRLDRELKKAKRTIRDFEIAQKRGHR